MTRVFDMDVRAPASDSFCLVRKAKIAVEDAHGRSSRRTVACFAIL